MQIGTNHLGHFLLTYLLMDYLLAVGKGAKIINVSSVGHRLFTDALPATPDGMFLLSPCWIEKEVISSVVAMGSFSVTK
jgi:NAD(P)-dependent dehydrogenase (short-subunit alcohol dehydrogenase family)